MPSPADPHIMVNLKQLVSELHRIFESNSVNIDEVKQLMLSYDGNAEEWSKYAIYEPGKYTKTLVDEGNGKFNLVMVGWSGNTKSPIHDHSDSHCFMRILSGELEEVRYDWPSENVMQLKNKTKLALGDVSYVNNSIGLHLVENRSSNTAVSFHLYSPPITSCFTFDEKTGNKAVATVTFWNR